jgi:plastocyanin
VDPTYQPEPNATPYPDCWQDEFLTESPAPGGSPGASPAPGGSPAASPGASAGASPAPGGSPGAGTTVQIVASGIQFTTTEVTAPADQPFAIEFDNQDSGVPHDVDIRDQVQAVVFNSEPFNGVETRTLDVPALGAATYQFFCSIHPNMTGTLTVQ